MLCAFFGFEPNSFLGNLLDVRRPVLARGSMEGGLKSGAKLWQCIYLAKTSERSSFRAGFWANPNQISPTYLLIGRKEPFQDTASQYRAICLRHYLTQVTVGAHRVALTKLLIGEHIFASERLAWRESSDITCLVLWKIDSAGTV